MTLVTAEPRKSIYSESKASFGEDAEDAEQRRVADVFYFLRRAVAIYLNRSTKRQLQLASSDSSAAFGTSRWRKNVGTTPPNFVDCFHVCMYI